MTHFIANDLFENERYLIRGRSLAPIPFTINAQKRRASIRLLSLGSLFESRALLWQQLQTHKGSSIPGNLTQLGRPVQTGKSALQQNRWSR